MYFYEVCEIGRESVKSVNASTLANLIKKLVNIHEKTHSSKLQHRRYYIKCKEKLEIVPKNNKKIGDDEGFESDANEDDSGDFSNEDAQSTTSSYCFVEDHVFKSSKTDVLHQNPYAKDPTSLVSIIGSIDSANSSGSSDTDELDMHSLTPSPTSQFNKPMKLSQNFTLDINHEKKQTKIKKEEYPIADVIFCHTETKYPNIIAWVIKKSQTDTNHGSRLGITGVESFSKLENCLEVIVVKCKNSDDLKDLCADYQEYNKRLKLEQYKTIKRKKDEKYTIMSSSPAISSKDVKVSLSDMKIASSSLIKASELCILNPKIISSFKNDLKNSVSLNSLNKPEQTNQNVRGNHDFKSTTHLGQTSVKKTQSLMNLSKTWDLKFDTLLEEEYGLKNKVSPLKDEFNLIQRTDLNGVTHLEVSKAKDNRNILTEKFPANKSKLRKEIEGVILTDVESYAKKEPVRQRQSTEDSELIEAPPIRPERKKYLKRKPTAMSPADKVKPELKISQPMTKSSGSFYLNFEPNENKEQKILKGPYVRVQSWGSQNVADPTFNSGDTDLKSSHVNRRDEKYIDRRRSKSAGRPVKKTPMAYRYVDVTNGYNNSSVKAPKIKEYNINLTDPLYSARRRKSFDDVIALDNIKGNLKSVIKKNKKINHKCCEPKKVTFSAFATVQVVD